MNKVYIYDGSFSGLIALIVELFKYKIIPFDIKENDNYSLFDETININIKDKKDNFNKISKKLSNNIMLSIYYVYLSSKKNKEIIIYNFLKESLKYGDKVYYYRKIDSVNDVIKIESYVRHEAHKLKGFLRFKEMKNGFLFAKFTSTNNVIGILANHFKKRLSNNYWIINDEKRNIYALYDKEKVFYLTKENIIKLNLDLSSKEKTFEELWKTFFKTIAIKERKNLRCQKNFMPKKYWSNILEMSDDNYEKSNI